MNAGKTEGAGRFRFARPVVSQTLLTLVIAAYLLAVLNTGFWLRVTEVFPQSLWSQVAFGAGVLALTVLTLELLAPWRLQRPVAAVLIMIAASAHYFEQNMGVLIDREMVRNVFETTPTEAGHLITARAIWYIGLTGVLPAALIFLPKVRRLGPWHQLWRWPLGVALALTALAGILISDFGTYSSALRVHRDVMARYQPGASLAALENYLTEQWADAGLVARPLGTDARPGPFLGGCARSAGDVRG